MKKAKRDKINLVFSSFLVIGYIICAYFFVSLATQVGGVGGNIIMVLIPVLFGLLLFYATRVGEGRQIKRFSLAVLLLVVVPSLYILLAALIPGLPFPSFIALTTESGSLSLIVLLACVALGYGIPYTFFSGYELRDESEELEEEIEEKEQMLEGGLAEELAETEAREAAEEAAEETAEAIEEAAEDAEESAEETAEAVEETAEEAVEEVVETEKEDKE